MSTAAQIENMFATIGDRVFNGGPVRKARMRRGLSGLTLVRESQPEASATDKAKRARAKLGSIVRRSPQVMVRVSGGGKTASRVKAHIDYISRNGRIDLEDHNGDKFQGKNDVLSLKEEFEFGGFPMDDEAGVKQAFNIVLSMPAGTDELAVLRAARDFSADEFGNFQYCMALHTADTDPNKNPSPNPHVHLCVKAMGLDGIRMNPRKADLQRWRDKFAERLRDHGIEASSTKRLHRLQSERGQKQSIRHKLGRGEVLKNFRLGVKGRDARREARARESEQALLGGYRVIASTLAKSGAAEDRLLALGLVDTLSGRIREQIPAINKQGRSLEQSSRGEK